jgi:signal transduction histidine kinase
MRRIPSLITRRLSVKLGLSIVLIVAVIFTISASCLFYLTKDYIQQEAIKRATQILDNTALRINDIMGEVETTTDDMGWYIASQTNPDSIISDTRKILENNEHFYSCSISMEPYYFKRYGKYFSIYSVRDADSISTAQYGSDEFNYFNIDWYQKPKELQQGYWSDPFLNTNPKADYKQEIITSYCRPVYDYNGDFIGVVAIDLQQKWLSQAVTAVAPYPNSSSIMIGTDGKYLVHPDTTKLIHQSIFSDPDPRSRDEVVSLGKEMIAGNSGMRRIVVDGQSAFIFYRPIGNAGWSMAIVCPESDVFYGYYKLLYTVWGTIIIGLLFILFVCYLAVRGGISPLSLLAQQSHDIAEGRMDNLLPRTKRTDTIGQLQNSFVDMQQSLKAYMNNIQLMNTQMEQRNQELKQANEQAIIADNKKTAFLKDMMHQIRTPLNIIGGFAQVLNENFHELPDDETSNIIYMIQDNSRKFVRISRMLVAASTNENEVITNKTCFSCNALCREIISSFRLTSPHMVKLHFESTLPDDFNIYSDQEKVKGILLELLDNANKFTQQGTITLACSQPDARTVNIRVSDTGIGIPQANRQQIFAKFAKIDDFTEGVGLGLPLSKRTATILGGNLILDPFYNEGASFIFSLSI